MEREMFKSCALLVVLSVLSFSPLSNGDYIDFKDGGTHIVDYDAGTLIYIDRDAPNAGTKVEFKGGGVVDHMLAYNNSQINITGGLISPDLRLWDNAVAFMSGGQVGTLANHQSSQFTLTDGILGTLNLSGASKTILKGGQIKSIDARGNSELIYDGCSMTRTLLGTNNFYGKVLSGFIEEGINIRRSSTIEVSGGVIGGYISIGSLDPRDNESSLMILKGTDFTINGSVVEPGKYASDYVMPDFSGKLTGVITGTLANGDHFDSLYYVYENSDIQFVVPEPATLILFGLSGLFLRYRRNGKSV